MQLVFLEAEFVLFWVFLERKFPDLCPRANYMQQFTGYFGQKLQCLTLLQLLLASTERSGSHYSTMSPLFWQRKKKSSSPHKTAQFCRADFGGKGMCYVSKYGISPICQGQSEIHIKSHQKDTIIFIFTSVHFPSSKNTMQGAGCACMCIRTTP